MKYFALWTTQVLLFLCISSSNAQASFSDLSPCTLSCLLETFPAAGCSFTNTTCQCENQALKESTSRCMLSNCTLPDTLALGKLQESVCGIKPQSRQHQMLLVNLLTSSLAICAILLRLFSRLLVSKRVWSDDILITVVGVLVFPYCGLGTWMVLNGLGTHTWDNSAAVVTKIFEIFWIDEIFYLVILMLTKISILLFYRRVFPSRGFQLLCNTVLGFVVLSGSVILLSQILQCIPVKYNWDKSIHHHKCINVNALTYAHAGLNIVQDFLILALPIPWILRLKLQLEKKIGLVIMFQVGAFACITAIIRLRFLTEFGGTNSTDPLWENAASVMWTAAETNSAIICSCLPAIRALYKTSKKLATEVSSKRKSITLRSGGRSGGGSGGGILLSNKSKMSDPDTIEEHRLDLAEEWVRKDALEDRKHGPITITNTDLGSSGSSTDKKKAFYMPDLTEEPEEPVRFVISPRYRR